MRYNYNGCRGAKKRCVKWCMVAFAPSGISYLNWDCAWRMGSDAPPVRYGGGTAKSTPIMCIPPTFSGLRKIKQFAWRSPLREGK